MKAAKNVGDSIQTGTETVIWDLFVVAGDLGRPQRRIRTCRMQAHHLKYSRSFIQTKQRGVLRVTARADGAQVLHVCRDLMYNEIPLLKFSVCEFSCVLSLAQRQHKYHAGQKPERIEYEGN